MANHRFFSYVFAPTFTSMIVTMAAVSCAFDRPESGPRRVIEISQISVAIELVADGLQRPVAVRHAGDGSGRLFIVEQPGRIRILDKGSLLESPFLDITARVRDAANEQGLLGLAFHPEYADNGRFFVNYTDLGGDTVVAEFSRSPADAVQADPSSEAIILRIPQPYGNHNGGDIAFGPDDYLWIATGDGGGAGDPQGSGQNLQTLLGKLLRIDVDRGSTYTIPPDNPFTSDSQALDEIWAYGLRNPWRFSFDRDTGDLYIGDVGQNQLEEIDFEERSDPGGRNYGWSTMEASSCFENINCSTDGLTLPVAEYSHQLGCSVTGGYVYRGSLFPDLQGYYLYGDFCSGTVWALSRSDSGQWSTEIVGETGASISSFGEDEDGELYVTDLRDGSVYLVTGRAVPPKPRSPSARVAPPAP
jgi:glucose/arabinose dehydrogenase